jgi:hypothetical protein
VKAKRTIDSSMAVNGVNIRPTSLALAFALALGVSSTVRADDTWHNVYHSLKRFFTGSKSSPTPSAHHHVKHSGEKNAEPSSSMSPLAEDMAKGGGSPAASSTPRVIVLPAATPVVILPAATPMREASSEATPSEAIATPTPVARPAGQTAPDPADPNSKSQPAVESGPVLRSLSGPAVGASPSPQRTATP